MSVSMTGRLTSPTSPELVHRPSGSLVACAATTLSLYATRSGIPLTGITFEIEKHMTAESPRRIAKLVARFRVSSPCGDEDFRKLVNAGKTCPVKRLLPPGGLVEEIWGGG